jgi:hypothetical protein
MGTSQEHQILAERFVACFATFNEMAVFEGLDPIAEALWTGELDEPGRKRWLPAKVVTDRAMLDPIYEQLPNRFPPLYEFLVLNYRWAEMQLDSFTLMPNPIGPDLSALLVRDPHLWNFLLPRGYVQFAKGPDMNYDPVCLDMNKRSKSGDYHIVRIDHEEILCFERFKIVAELAHSFEALVKATLAQSEPNSGTPSP